MEGTLILIPDRQGSCTVIIFELLGFKPLDVPIVRSFTKL